MPDWRRRIPVCCRKRVANVGAVRVNSLESLLKSALFGASLHGWEEEAKEVVANKVGVLIRCDCVCVDWLADGC